MVALLLLGAAPVHAATEQPTIDLDPATRASLGAIRASWSSWLSACDRGDVEGAHALVDRLLVQAQEVGASRLPDLSRAATVTAIEAARLGELERADVAIESAERLDPGRPEVARARARLERERGAWLAALVAWGESGIATLRLPLERLLWWNDLLIWGLLLLLVAGGLFACIVVGLRAWRVPLEIARILRRIAPAPVAYPATLVLMVWPVVLPAGPLWLLAYWSALSWAYATVGERILLVAVWLLAGAAPVLVSAQSERLAMTLTPPARALESLETGRLTGTLFSDLEVLRSLLPDSVATVHLLADVHRRLGQWQRAGQLYRSLLAEEPRNEAAIIDLAAYRFQFGDIEGARLELERALVVNPGSAAAYYNLSQVHSAAYEFGPAEAALLEARARDPERVSEWVRRARETRLVSLDGGLARTEEVRRDLTAAWGESGLVRSWSDLLLRALSIPWALATIALAVGFHLVRGRGAPAPVLQTPAWWSAGFSRALEVLVPGLRNVAEGRAGRGFLALLLPVALVTLPVVGALTFRLPAAGVSLLPAWIPVLLALASYYAWRARHAWRGR